MNKEVDPKQITDGYKRTEESFEIKPAAYRELLKNRNYLRLWIGQIISAMGDWFIVGALFALVYKLSSSSSAISLMMFSRFLPAILLGFLAGVFIDRWNRKATLIFCDLARGALVIAFAFANSLAMVCILTFVVETFSIIYNPAKDASIPLIVEKDQLLNANSLSQVSLFASMALGMGAAGGLIGIFEFLGKHVAIFGPAGFLPPQKAVFFIDSLSFLASAWLIYRIQFGLVSAAGVNGNGANDKAANGKREKTDAAQVKNDFMEGFRYMKSHRLTRLVLFLVVTCFLGGGTVYVLTVGFTHQVLHRGDASFLTIVFLLLTGMMFGAIGAGALKSYLRKEKLIAPLVSFFGAGIVIFALITPFFWFTLIICLLAGTCMGYAVVGMITIMHENLAEEFRGRVFSAIQTLMRSSIFVSIIIAGPLADLINNHLKSVNIFGWHIHLNGPQVILAIGGVVITLAGLYSMRGFRKCFASTDAAGFPTLECDSDTETLKSTTASEAQVEGERIGVEDEAEAREAEETIEGKNESDGTDA